MLYYSLAMTSQDLASRSRVSSWQLIGEIDLIKQFVATPPLRSLPYGRARCTTGKESSTTIGNYFADKMKLLTRSEMRHIDPVNLMVSIEGERKIPLEVSLVVCCGVMLCAAIICWKPWSKRFAILAPSKVAMFRNDKF